MEEDEETIAKIVSEFHVRFKALKPKLHERLIKSLEYTLTKLESDLVVYEPRYKHQCPLKYVEFVNMHKTISKVLKE